MARWHDWIDGHGRDSLGHTVEPRRAVTDEECFPLVLDEAGVLLYAAVGGGWTSSRRQARQGGGDYVSLDELDRRWGPLTRLEIS